MSSQNLLEKIRTVPDFPKKGIMFRDVTTLFKDGPAFHATVDVLYERYTGMGIQKVVCIEARGFALGAPLAYRLGAGFVPVRKPGKLPAATTSESYALEYGTDTIEMHLDALLPGERVLMHDDLLATGGTMAAACRLVERARAEIVAVSFLIELTPLKGRTRLSGYDVHSLVQYDTD
jgi:adenine phosphoribosyltransferase